MTAVLPIYPITMPTSLKGAQNGRLTMVNLKSVPFSGSGYGALHPLAARAWLALTVACIAETKAQLTAVSIADAYRNYALQEQVFRQRYRPNWNPLTCTRESPRRWGGRVWWKLKRVAPVAAPGESNHGWGLAVDVGVWRGGPQVVPITADPTVWTWLQANAVSLGFCWESQKEPWHIRYFCGDVLPQRVLDIEAFLNNIKP